MTARHLAAALGLGVLVSALLVGMRSHRPTPTSREWRLAEEMVAADGLKSFLQGSKAMRIRRDIKPVQGEHDDSAWEVPALAATNLERLFYWRHLILLPEGTRVATSESAPAGVKKIRLLDGPRAGQVWWLFPESAERLGFLPSTASISRTRSGVLVHIRALGWGFRSSS